MKCFEDFTTAIFHVIDSGSANLDIEQILGLFYKIVFLVPFKGLQRWNTDKLSLQTLDWSSGFDDTHVAKSKVVFWTNDRAKAP